MNVHHIVLSSCRTRATPFSIYKDSIATSEIDPDKPNQSQSWRTLGARADRKKGKQYNSRQVKIFQGTIFSTFFLLIMVDDNNLTKLYLIFGCVFLLSFDAQFWVRVYKIVLNIRY